MDDSPSSSINTLNGSAPRSSENTLSATEDELRDLNSSQEQMNTAISVLEALSRVDQIKRPHKNSSKAWKRMLWSINTIATSATTSRFAERRRKWRLKNQRKREVTARFRLEHNSRKVADPPSQPPPIAHPIGCYVCKEKFAIESHHPMYWSMCMRCGDFNARKRVQTCDLTGKIAIVTGARVKIGFQVALKLLRAGCFVIATSRFVADAQARYANQSDYKDWQSRLLIARLELGNRAVIEMFCTAMHAFSHIDYLINNAAQTISRPREYYRDVIAQELECDEKQFLICNALDASDRLLEQTESSLLLEQTESSLLLEQTKLSLLLLNTQTDLIEMTHCDASVTFPSGALDLANDNQQLDLRTSNSWVQTLETAPVEELLQDLAINCAAPFILIQRLTPLLANKVVNASQMVMEDHSAIINVSAVEGMFHVRNKSAQHPSSNAAKAALNMITRTSGVEYWRKHRIAMNAVDTGLVTNEYPVGHKHYGKTTPLDEVDGAARILDPIFAPRLNATRVYYGVLLKDYEPANW